MDVQVYLTPISDSEPVGRSVRYEQDYYDLEEARRSDDEIPKDEKDPWRRETKRADWDHVIKVGTRILLEKSKDLQVVAFMTEAWAYLRGLAGIIDGLELLRAIQDTFWEDVHPRPEDGDWDPRRGVYEFLDDPKLLPLRIHNLSLTRVEGSADQSYSYRKYKEAGHTQQEINKGKSEEFFEGNLRLEDFDKAAEQTPRGFYVATLEGLQGCRAAVERLNEQVAAKWPSAPRERAPQLSHLLTALEEVEVVARRLLGRKPAPANALEPAADEPPAADETESLPEDGSNEEAEEQPTPRPVVSRRARRPVPPAGALNNADDALARIVDAAHFLRRADPADPVSYLVLRALQAARLYRGDDPLASGNLPAPASEVRERLYQMSRETDGDQSATLLDESEQALGLPEGCGWLDPHFYSARSLEALGYDHAARACKAILATCLKDHEPWTGAVLGDGTPSASRATRDWIEREFRAPERADRRDLDGRIGPMNPAVIAPVSDGSVSADGAVAEPDPWEEARALSQSGRLNEAISLMVRAVRQARTGRERFLRTLQQAELCLASDRPALALPLLEMLAQRIDEMRLEQWEDGSICARVLAHLYRCLKGKDDARAAAIYSRLCQIDAGEALLLGAT